MQLNQQNIIKSKHANYIAVAKTDVNVRTGPGTKYTKIKTFSQNQTIGYIKAFYKYKANGNVWYLLRLYIPYNNRKTCWISAPYFYTRKNTISTTSTKKVIKELINNDTTIYKRIITTLALIENCKKHGINTYQAEKTIIDLTDRYNKRQSLLKSTQAIKLSTFNDSLYIKLRTWLTVQRIAIFGAVPLYIVAAVGAAIGITATISLYYLFKPKYDESEKDLIISKDLKKLLENLPEEQQKLITKDLEKQIDNAYYEGKKSGMFSTGTNLLKYGLIALGIYTGYNIVTEQTQKIKKRTSTKALT